MQKRKITFWDFIKVILFGAGIFLLLVNRYGLSTSLRSPTLQEDINQINKKQIIISQEEIYHAINSDTRDKKEYARMLTETIHNGIGHYWGDENIDKMHLRIPFQENYILFLGSYIYPQKFLKYELLNYHRAIERGVGICSEHAIILAQILYEKGIKTHVVGLDGHVVTTALVDESKDEWWILDADYGVVVPYDIGTIEKDPNLVDPFYTAQGYDQQVVTALEGYYGKDGNTVIDGYGIGNYSIKTHIFEEISYILIWIIPCLLILPFSFSLVRSIKSAKAVRVGISVENVDAKPVL